VRELSGYWGLNVEYATQQTKAQGALDWEAFFETPPNGIIPLLSGAKSARALSQCSVLVVESLFTRDGDDEKRRSFLGVLQQVIPDPAAEADVVEHSKLQLAQIFRHIKEDRKARAQAARESKERAEAEEALDLRGEQSEFLPETVDNIPPAPPVELDDENDAFDPNRLFSQAFWESMRERFTILLQGAQRETLEKVRSPLPFLLSAEFIEHFGSIVVADIAPRVANKAKTLVRSASIKDDKVRLDYLREQIADPNNRPLLWEAWKLAWEERTREQKIPPKPKEEPKGGGLSFLKKKTPAKPGLNQMSLEDWETLSARITRDNQDAQRIWDAILAPSAGYQAPVEEDNVFLMEMYGRSPAALKKQIDAVRQIASQGGEVGRAFDTYRRNNHPDLGILSASFLFPELFLDPKSGCLKAMLRSYRRSELRRNLPFTARYLGDALNLNAPSSPGEEE